MELDKLAIVALIVLGVFTGVFAVFAAMEARDSERNSEERKTKRLRLRWGIPLMQWIRMSVCLQVKNDLRRVGTIVRTLVHHHG
jgi:hypothetical protein